MPTVRLTQRRVDALRPGRKVFDIRDAELKGYGVRAMPSGAKRYFVHAQNQGRRVWKTLGDAAVLTEADARPGQEDAGRAPRRWRSRSAGPRRDGVRGGGRGGLRPLRPPLEARTLAANRIYLRRQIVPFFEGRPIASIAREDVQRWFRSLHATPAAANRAAPILSVILQQAEAWGYRSGSGNPCKGIRRYRPGRSERFLSPGEYRRLARVLDDREADQALRVAALRLLFLTGCRKSEILTLEWRFYRDGDLHLPDSKTGPRTVWLSAAARAVLDRLPRSGRWVFPARGRYPSDAWLYRFWWRVREEADLRDVRIHDFRHGYASIALSSGESIRTVGRLLGHERAATALKYAHLSDAAVRKAVDALAPVLAGRRP